MIRRTAVITVASIGALGMLTSVQSQRVLASGGSPIVYVANDNDNTVMPIPIATNTAGSALHVGNCPQGLAITPDGTTAYVVNDCSDTVTSHHRLDQRPGDAHRCRGRAERHRDHAQRRDGVRGQQQHQ